MAVDVFARSLAAAALGEAKAAAGGGGSTVDAIKQVSGSLTDEQALEPVAATCTCSYNSHMVGIYLYYTGSGGALGSDVGAQTATFAIPSDIYDKLIASNVRVSGTAVYYSRDYNVQEGTENTCGWTLVPSKTGAQTFLLLSLPDFSVGGGMVFDSLTLSGTVYF